MAGILDRFTSIIKANINDLLDRAEDPAKMIEQYMRDLTENLAEVKESTAAVMAEESRTKRLLDDNQKEIDKYEELARKALSAGNEGDARTFLTKKQELEGKNAGLQMAYATASENASKMRQMHDTLQERKEVIKAKTAVAKTQDKVNKMTAGTDRAEGAMSAFDRMEAKADEMLDRANAMEALNEKPKSETEELEKKYEAMGVDASVDEDLARLKAEMGM